MSIFGANVFLHVDTMYYHMDMQECWGEFGSDSFRTQKSPQQMRSYEEVGEFNRGPIT